MSELEELYQAQAELKRKALKFRGIKTHTFNGILYFQGMSFENMNDNELILSHVYLHKSYGMKTPALEKEDIEYLHTQIVSELNKRSLFHTKFDKLDRSQG